MRHKVLNIDFDLKNVFRLTKTCRVMLLTVLVMAPIIPLYLVELSYVFNYVIVCGSFILFSILIVSFTKLPLGGQVMAISAYAALLLVFLAQLG
jgi:hypothetical protein